MCESAEGKDKKPVFMPAPIQKKADHRNQYEECDGVTVYPAVAQGLSEKQLSYRFVNNVRQKRAYHEKPYIQAVSCRSNPRFFIAPQSTGYKCCRTKGYSGMCE